MTGIIKDVVCAIILIMAIVQDYSGMKISNRLIVGGWMFSIIYNIIYGRYASLADCVLGAVVPIILLLALFKIRVMGAGDIKLLSVIGSIFGVKSIIFVICYSFLIGAAFSLIKMLYNKNLNVRLQYLAEYFTKVILLKKVEPYVNFSNVSKKNMMHFSVCIGLGVMIFRLVGEISIF